MPASKLNESLPQIQWSKEEKHAKVAQVKTFNLSSMGDKDAKDLTAVLKAFNVHHDGN